MFKGGTKKQSELIVRLIKGFGWLLPQIILVYIYSVVTLNANSHILIRTNTVLRFHVNERKSL